jgi:hypothetical protein
MAEFLIGPVGSREEYFFPWTEVYRWPDEDDRMWSLLHLMGDRCLQTRVYGGERQVAYIDLYQGEGREERRVAFIDE